GGGEVRLELPPPDPGRLVARPRLLRGAGLLRGPGRRAAAGAAAASVLRQLHLLAEAPGPAARRGALAARAGRPAPPPSPPLPPPSGGGGERGGGGGGGANEGWATEQDRPPLPAETVKALSALARRHQLTLNTLFQGAWALLLARLAAVGGVGEVIFGSVVSGRPAELPGVESIVGLFINALPVRVKVDPAEALLPWLA